jgi:hypothetical protein
MVEAAPSRHQREGVENLAHLFFLLRRPRLQQHKVPLANNLLVQKYKASTTRLQIPRMEMNKKLQVGHNLLFITAKTNTVCSWIPSDSRSSWCHLNT